MLRSRLGSLTPRLCTVNPRPEALFSHLPNASTVLRGFGSRVQGFRVFRLGGCLHRAVLSKASESAGPFRSRAVTCLCPEGQVLTTDALVIAFRAQSIGCWRFGCLGSGALGFRASRDSVVMFLYCSKPPHPMPGPRTECTLRGIIVYFYGIAEACFC